MFKIHSYFEEKISLEYCELGSFTIIQPRFEDDFEAVFQVVLHKEMSLRIHERKEGEPVCMSKPQSFVRSA